MKTKIRHLLFVIFLSTLFLSCKKSNSNKSTNDQYYFKVTVNGQTTTFTSNVQCQLGPDAADASLSDFIVNGDNGKDLLTVSIQKSGSFSATSYSTDNPDLFCDISYITGFSGANFVDYSIDNINSTPGPSYTISITSVSASSIQGKITENYLYDDNDDKLMLTSAEFSAKRIP
jgi:hypothetical protein